MDSDLVATGVDIHAGMQIGRSIGRYGCNKWSSNNNMKQVF